MSRNNCIFFISYITLSIITNQIFSYSSMTFQPSQFCNAPKDKPHLSSYPYISGDTFRSYANFVIEDDSDYFDVTLLKNGDIIFVQTDYLKHFFQDIHDSINNTYILITHNSDDSSPGAYLKYLDDQRIIAWFGQNSDIPFHAKFISIPIGIANKSFDYGNTSLLDATIDRTLYTNSRAHSALLYMNFTITTNLTERLKAYNTFISAPFCTYAPRLAYDRYIKDLTTFQYVVSPEGNGRDCYRTWEAMLLGCIPIIKHSSLDPLFEGLPILIIDDWSDVSEDFLAKKYKILRHEGYQYEKLYMDYWINKIRNLQIKHA